MIDLTGLGYDADAAARVALGAALRAWRYDRYRTRLKDKQKPTLDRSDHRRRAATAPKRAGTSRWQPVLEGVALHPRAGHRAGQHHLSRKLRRALSRARRRASALELEVLDGEAMAKLGMGALLGVAQGSVREPRLLILRWNGGAKGAAPVAFVGKGVTFDTGGISIKPAARHGSHEVGHGRRRRGRRRACWRSRCARPRPTSSASAAWSRTCPTAMRSGRATSSPRMSGQTVEVINTDAEGRLVLCRRDHLGAAQLQADDDRRPRDADRRDPHQPRPRIWRAVLANDDALADELLAAGEAVGRQAVALAAWPSPTTS